MKLTLQIENYDVLEDGGPAQFTAQGRGFNVGRSGSMDWSLPDPSRHISGHHFEISFAENAYWLTDVSTNGTFLKGQRYRLEGAHRLTQGDRFQVGHYIIAVHLQGGAASAPVPEANPWAAEHAAPAADHSDPWSIGGGAVAPIDPLPRPDRRHFNDFSDDFIATPTPARPAPADFGFSAPADDLPPLPSAAPFPGAAPLAQVGAPIAASPALPAGAPLSVPPTSQATASATDATGFLAAFCEGAGLPSDAYAGVDPDALARELGQSMRITAQEMMRLLQDRASAKQFTKGGERTMRGATDNNPLKFLPDAQQALEAMFLKHRAGFMTGGDALSEALRDVRLHQTAVFAAIQPALTKLLGDLAPEQIEDQSSGGVLGAGKRAKAWQTYVERWDAKTHPHENGMLDEFLMHFAEAYARMTRDDRG